MVQSCCVVNCTNRAGKKKGLRFFGFRLSDKDECAKWIAAVQREGWAPTQYTKICSEHFIEGKPHQHSSHPDYVPSIFPEIYKKNNESATSTARLNRVQRRIDRSKVEEIKVQEQRAIEAEARAERKRQVEEKKRKADEEYQAKQKQLDEEREGRKREIEETNRRKEIEELQRFNREKERVARERREREEAKPREEEERKKQQEKEQQEEEARKLRIIEGKQDIQKEKLELERTIDDMRQRWVLLEKENRALSLDDGQQTSDDECIFFPASVQNVGQQTDCTVEGLKEIDDENKQLKEDLKMQRFDD